MRRLQTCVVGNKAKVSNVGVEGRIGKEIGGQAFCKVKWTMHPGTVLHC